MANNTVMASFPASMASSTKAIGLAICSTVKEKKNGQMAPSTWATLSGARKRARGPLDGLMARLIRGRSRTTNLMVLARTLGHRKAVLSLATGRRIRLMGKGH